MSKRKPVILTVVTVLLLALLTSVCPAVRTVAGAGDGALTANEIETLQGAETRALTEAGVFPAAGAQSLTKTVSGSQPASNGTGRSTGTWNSRMEKISGYGGTEYYKKSGYYVNIYGENGQIVEVRYKSGGSRQGVYVLEDAASGEKHYAYCLASGLAFRTAAEYGAAAEAEESFDGYYSVLPDAARKGIAYASIYGYDEEKMALTDPGPVEGTLGADFWIATQCIIWEYQQGIRTDTVARHTHGSVEADNYYSMIKGKPAEKCYDYLLTEIGKASGVPPFASGSEEGWALETVLDETSAGSGIYLKSIYNSNALPQAEYYVTDETGDQVPYISFSATGNYFSIVCTRTLEEPVNLIIRRVTEDSTAGAALFFAPSDESQQTMLSTAGRLEDPFVMYLRLSTRAAGSNCLKILINKEATDGNVANCAFVVIWLNMQLGLENQVVYTDSEGKAELLIPFGGTSGSINPMFMNVSIGEISGTKYNVSVTGCSDNVTLSTSYVAAVNYNGRQLWNSYTDANTAGMYSVDGKVYPGWKLSFAPGFSSSSDKTVSFDFLNDPRSGRVKLIKTSESGAAAGFRFELTGADPDNSETRIEKTTDAQGVAVWDGLLPGTYVLRELLPADSIWAQPDPVTVTVDPDWTTEVRLRNELKPGALKIIKTADDNIFDGVSFTMTDSDGAEVCVVEPDDDSVVDNNGTLTLIALLGQLKPGVYTVTENCPERYRTQAPFTVTVVSGETAELNIHNSLTQVSITVEKSIYTQEFVPAHGNAVFIFRICGPDSGRVLYRVLEFTPADVAGTEAATVTKSFSVTGLAPGSYTVEELKTVRYALESVRVSDNGRVSEQTAQFTLTMPDERGTAHFTNRVINQEKTTHTALCVNDISYSN